MENAQVKRKHFRFPAYDDEIGVKLPSENKRILFQDEINDEPLTAKRTEFVAPKKNEAAKDEQQLKQQQTQLARHKTNLPNYATRAKETEPAAKKKQSLFGTNKRAGWTQTYHKEVTRQTAKPRNTTTAYNSSYFVPTYVPASIIPDSDPEKPVFSETELLQAIKKDPASYLLLDDEPAAFQVKKRENEPTVKKFNIPSDAPEIPLTRRQYQKLKPNMERFDSDSLPLSRTEIKHAKKNANSQTAYGKKVAAANQEKKRAILDKPLSGIIEESGSQLENSKYFN
jgi:hypothetical protein